MAQRASKPRQQRKPFLLRYRSSVYYISAVAGMGLLTDVCLFPLFTPAIPFRLEQLGYSSISSRTGWLSAAYSSGLVVATLPFIWLGSRYHGKRNILLGALGLMFIAVLIFLLVPNYAAMVAARFLQGASGAGVWTSGLALVADNCDTAVLGKMMGLAMIGYSLGTSIGQPIGGVLYGQLGWKAPSVFALILVGIDFVMRTLVIEKHQLLKLRRQESIQEEAARVEAEKARTVSVDLNKTYDIPDTKLACNDEEPPADVRPQTTNHWRAVAYMLLNMKVITPLYISFTNGFLFSSLYNTALVLRLNQRYGLDSTQAGLVFFAVAVPSAIMSPLSGHLTDRFGPRPLSIICCSGFIIPLCLLTIEKLPLVACIVLLVFCGLASGLINSPVMVFLAYVAKASEGRVNTSHVYGGFNMTFSLAAFIGSIVAGQILEALGVATGFKVVLAIMAAMLASCIPLAWLYMRVEPAVLESTSEDSRMAHPA